MTLRIVILAAPSAAIDEAAPGGTHVDANPGTLSPRGALRVDETIAALAPADAGERLLLITDRDLSRNGCRRLFGFADHKRRVAIVSTFHLRDGAGSLARRLRNLIAHELNHLDGLGHCSNPGCLMSPAGNASDLDIRDDAACGRCPRHARWWSPSWARIAAAVLTLAFMIGGMEAGLRLMLPEFEAPFS